VQTLALLDSGSTGTFCTDELAKQLNLVGKQRNLLISTVEQQGLEVHTKEVQLIVTDISSSNRIVLPTVYTRPTLQISADALSRQLDMSKYRHLNGVVLPEWSTYKVHLIIGQDMPEALVATEVRRGGKGEPWASKTALGWTIHGPLCEGAMSHVSVNHSVCVEQSLDVVVERFWKLDDPSAFDVGNERLSWSQEDRMVIKLWQDQAEHLPEGHYQLPLPFKDSKASLSNNRQIALFRLQLLKKRLDKDAHLKQKYVDSMEVLITRGYAEKLPTQNTIESEPVWYLPHHAVTSKNKPDKLRVVLDCAAKFKNVSLNDVVHQGPDLLNSLNGVLLRFREQPVAFAADIETMYYQVKVVPEHRNVLRFLWWPNGDSSSQPATYRMTVHPFGGVWSPSCANFVLHKTADDNESEFSANAINSVRKSFYVDDCLKSCKTEANAVQLAAELQLLLMKGHFHLTKFISNSRAVLMSLKEEDRANGVKKIDIVHDALPTEKTLGVVWDVQCDCFSFITSAQEKPMTRRGMLSVTSSLYDPLGFVAPFVLPAKLLIQEVTKAKLSWDENVPEMEMQSWRRWLADLHIIEQFKIPRSVTPQNFGQMAYYELHHFCDASVRAYGVVSYVRVVNEVGEVNCTLMMAKSRLAPIKAITIPRLELMAAAQAVKQDKLCMQELELAPLRESKFWTDSMIVLSYIKSQGKRYQIFVANRLSMIHAGSEAHQWRYVATEDNPADHVSRGMSAKNLVSSSVWNNGPSFLWTADNEWSKKLDIVPEVPSDDKECIAKSHVYVTDLLTDDLVSQLIQHYSSWFRLKKAIVWLLRFKALLRLKCLAHGANNDKPLGAIMVKELKEAANAVYKHVQRVSFAKEIGRLRSGKPVTKDSALYKLCPVIDEYGVLRVGGRLVNANIADEGKHPIILPASCHVAKLIIVEYHASLGHVGKEHVLASIREKFWLIKGRVVVRAILSKCVICRKRNATPLEQRMADLPEDRVTANKPAFTYVGVDYFGPFEVKRARSVLKRYGCVFTCLTTRAIHIEVANSLETDCFLQVLMRFIARRGKPEVIRSDNGSNFVGARKEMTTAIKAWNETPAIDSKLKQREIQWIMNPPGASHMGGAWERQIRTIRSVLFALCKEQSMDDESLVTLMCIAESIVNSRPLSTVSDDVNDPEPLTPNHILLLRAGSVAPMDNFTKNDAYRRRWRQVQYLADVFWRRWINEYLPSLQMRSKWQSASKNLKSGDVVMVLDERSVRGQWPLGRVMEAYAGSDGLVRSVRVKTRAGYFVRPVTKLCLLESP
jgi:transposase InsO family protein